ncbi:unnamed protein product [Rhizophagus irregularis]|uniref:Uncharacterized protein n=1 Tax=Rhizophagus irregularis TaxID=588596 RepID=A0A915ZAU7_9GLOM|nr:unnamed protein product [Rhizophagus irregularis]CAB5369608.1 unnamed protein product [Rhizophagus irregularis]
MNQIVNNWQVRAKNSIIEYFMESCFPRLHEKKEAWNKVLDIVILSMFSRDTKIIRGGRVLEMVQYGFAQLCSFKRLADLNTLQKDAITVQIAEPVPILAFREYIRKHPEVFETKVGCQNIDKLNLLSYEATIRNFDDRNSAIFSSNGTMKDGFNLPAFLNNPTTAFFMPEKEAGPDLVCIVEFHTPNGIVEVPLFLQAKLVKDPPGDTGESKYCKAHELSWIRFLVVFPAETKQRTVASYYNYSKANELFIVIDPSNAELFFSSFGHNVLKELKRIADNDKLESERATKKIKTSD